MGMIASYKMVDPDVIDVCFSWITKSYLKSYPKSMKILDTKQSI